MELNLFINTATEMPCQDFIFLYEYVEIPVHEILSRIIKKMLCNPIRMLSDMLILVKHIEHILDLVESKI